MMNVKKMTILIALALMAIPLGTALADTPTAPPFPTNTPTPTSPQFPTFTPTAGPTTTPLLPQMQLSLNQEYYLPLDVFSLNVVVANPEVKTDLLLQLYLDVAGSHWYYPNWDLTPHTESFSLNGGTIDLNQAILATLPDYFQAAVGSFNATLWKDNPAGAADEEIDTQTVDFALWAPSPTPTPEFPCRRGWARIVVRNIPTMTDANKNELNKTLFFCLRDENDMNFTGVYHRYIQQNWPHGPWWVAWRMEAGAEPCVRETDIWQSSPLSGDTVQFLVQWDAHAVTITNENTGDDQMLFLDNTVGFDFMGFGHTCSKWGWESPAFPELVEIECDLSGPPLPCWE